MNRRAGLAMLCVSTGAFACASEPLAPDGDSLVEVEYLERRAAVSAANVDPEPGEPRHLVGEAPSRTVAPGLNGFEPRAEAHDHDRALDFVEPPAPWTATWSEETTSRRTLDELAYVVVNDSNEPATVTVSLQWDAGMTTVRDAVIGRFVVEAGERSTLSVDPRDIPGEVLAERHPGLVGLTIASEDNQVVLPAWFVVPRDAALLWDESPELITLEEMTETLATVEGYAEEGVALSRVVEWVPSGPTADEDGGA